MKNLLSWKTLSVSRCKTFPLPCDSWREFFFIIISNKRFVAVSAGWVLEIIIITGGRENSFCINFKLNHENLHFILISAALNPFAPTPHRHALSHLNPISVLWRLIRFSFRLLFLCVFCALLSILLLFNNEVIMEWILLYIFNNVFEMEDDDCNYDFKWNRIRNEIEIYFGT